MYCNKSCARTEQETDIRGHRWARKYGDTEDADMNARHQQLTRFRWWNCTQMNGWELISISTPRGDMFLAASDLSLSRSL